MSDQDKKGNQVKKLSRYIGEVWKLFRTDPSEFWSQFWATVWTWKVAGTLFLIWLVSMMTWGVASYIYGMDNRELAGKLKQKSEDYTQLQHDIESVRDLKRDKESEVGRLTTEKAALENKLLFVQTLPETTVSLVSNLYQLAASEPTNRQSFLQLAGTLTNFLNNLEVEKPRLELIVNGITLSNNQTMEFMGHTSTNWNILRLNSSRTFTNEIRNLSGISGDNLVIEVTSDIPPTDWLAPQWTSDLPLEANLQPISNRFPLPTHFMLRTKQLIGSGNSIVWVRFKVTVSG